MKHFIFVVTLIFTLTTAAYAQGTWKGFDMTRTTDAFALDVPVGTTCLIVDEYGSYKRFGKAPNEDGKHLSSTEYVFDDNGYLTNRDGEEYKNSYNADGLIEQRDLFNKDGEFKERWIYKYLNDEKGPGVLIELYDADGNSKGVKAWQGNLYYSGAGGGDVKYTLNKAGKEVEGTITVTNYRQEVKIHQKMEYNDHGYIETNTMSAPGRNQITSYSDYEYDENGIWIKRYSDQKLTKRKILSESEYKEMLEDRKKEAERKRLAKIAEKVTFQKLEIAKRGYAYTEQLYSCPVAKLLDIAEIDSYYPMKFEINIPNSTGIVSYHADSHKKDDVLFTLNITNPAKFKFANDSIESVQSRFSGKISSKFLRKKVFTKPMEVKVDFNKNAAQWEVKNPEKIQKGYGLSNDEIEALKSRVRERGKEMPYKAKKLYFGGLYQLEVFIKPDESSAIQDEFRKTFPIRFLVIDKK